MPRPKKVKSLKADLIADLELEIARQEAEGTQWLSFREFIAHPDFCNLQLSPVLWAIVDASEGRPVTTLDDAMCRAVFCGHGLDVMGKERKRPKVIDVIAGRGGGKTSRLEAPKALHAAWTIKYPHAMSNEVLRVPFTTPLMGQSESAIEYVQGFVQQSRTLRTACISKIDAKESITLQRPDGQKVELFLTAPQPKGNNFRGPQPLSAFIDEALFFFTIGYAVNDQDQHDAVMPRLNLIPDAQLRMFSTPWIKGQGLAEEFIQQFRDNPDGDILAVCEVSTYMLRGEEDCGQYRGTLSQEVYDREILAKSMPAGSTCLFSPKAIDDAAKRKATGELTALAGGVDWGFERDCTAGGFGGRYQPELFAALGLKMFRPADGIPLVPSQVARDVCAMIKEAGCIELWSDPFSQTTMREHCDNNGVSLRVFTWNENSESKWSFLITVKDRFEDPSGPTIVLGDLPDAERALLVTALKKIAKIPLPGGTYKIVFPASRMVRGVSTGHADEVSCLLAILWGLGLRAGIVKEEKKALPPALPTPDAMQVAMREAQQRTQLGNGGSWVTMANRLNRRRT